jgi:hypothetical protein
MTCGASSLNTGRRPWRDCLRGQGRTYGSTSTSSRKTARSCSTMPASSGLRASCRSGRTPVQVGAFAALDQEQEPKCAGSETRSRGGLGKAAITTPQLPIQNPPAAVALSLSQNEDSLLRSPIVAVAGCCARAASGPAIAARLSKVMNSRLLSLNHPSAMVSSLAGTLRRSIFAFLRLHPWCPLPSKQLRILIRKLVPYGLPQHSLSAGQKHQ